MGGALAPYVHEVDAQARAAPLSVYQFIKLVLSMALVRRGALGLISDHCAQMRVTRRARRYGAVHLLILENHIGCTDGSERATAGCK